MRIKKFEAETEQKAIEMVKDEFGLDALVLSIKKTKPRGLFSFLRKPLVEVTAAMNDERQPDTKKAAAAAPDVASDIASEAKMYESDMRSLAKEMERDTTISEQENKIRKLENMLVSTEEMLRNAERRLMVSSYRIQAGERRFRNNIVQTFYDTLVSQGVKENIADKIMSDLDLIEENEKIDIHFIVKLVYNAIIGIIGEPQPVEPEKAKKGEPEIIAFVGSTGVGKTTTIAKLSADFILNRGLNVGLITADTYRIAAVEQLKVYADILGIEVGVVYVPQDLAEYAELMSSINDVIMIDTAGRSHRNRENLAELKELLSTVRCDEIFLVLSLATKYEDMVDIVETYSSAFDFKIIFTKLDETLSLGSVVNLCFETGKKVSYITFGQNVPDDIKTLKAEDIAKAVLGMIEG